MTLGAVDPPPFPTRNILGVEISVARQREAIEFLLARLAARLPTQVPFANANLLTELSGRVARGFWTDFSSSTMASRSISPRSLSIACGFPRI
jgi:hypothetical protein